jgi:uncharacterized protein (DUF2235 family)
MRSRTALTYIGLLLVSSSAGTLVAQAPRGPRNIVIALDGTGNSEDVDTRGRIYVADNIIRTVRAANRVRLTSKDIIDQMVYYSEGVGSAATGHRRVERIQGFLDRFLGGLFGGGFESKVKSAYRFLVANYNAGDRVFIFGFSRGGAEAQSLVAFIDWIGGVLEQEDVFFTAEFFDRFRDRLDSHYTGADAFKHIRRSRPSVLSDARALEIQFLGLYDPVLSLGSTEERIFGAGEAPPAIVKTVRVALAIDERRWDFRPQIWRVPTTSQSLVERWFPGSHSNVGGGYARDGLAYHALQWMLSEAARYGLEVDHRYLVQFAPTTNADRPDTDAGWTRLGEILRLKYGRGVRPLDRGSGIEVDESALSLLIQDRTYRPDNLITYLAQHQEQITKLSEGQQAAVREIVKEFMGGRAKQTPRPAPPGVTPPR